MFNLGPSSRMFKYLNQTNKKLTFENPIFGVDCCKPLSYRLKTAKELRI